MVARGTLPAAVVRIHRSGVVYPAASCQRSSDSGGLFLCFTAAVAAFLRSGGIFGRFDLCRLLRGCISAVLLLFVFSLNFHFSISGYFQAITDTFGFGWVKIAPSG